MRLPSALEWLLVVGNLGSVAFAVQVSSPAPLGFEEPPGPLQPGQILLVSVDGGAKLQKPTIQAAVNAAAEGDTILLTPGYFRGEGNRAVMVEGKNLTIRSTHGRATTLVDCEGLDRAFHFRGASVSTSTRLVGVTIANGSAFLGGGILCDGSSSPRIEDCTIAWCEAGIGGGLHYIPDPSATSAPSGGALRGCSLLGNRAGNGAGGLVGGVLVERCLIAGNHATISGGGLYCGTRFTTIRDCLIANNTAVDNSGPPMAVGGGLAVGVLDTLIQDCTLVGNVADNGGGGVVFFPDVGGVIANSILWNNAAPVIGSQILAGSYTGTAAPIIRYCDVQGGRSGIETSVVSGGTLRRPTISGILNEDPQFRGGGDYRLSPSSPCIDRGAPSYVAVSNQGDFYGQPRQNGRVDIGADEYWEGMTASIVWPARAGETNAISVEGARIGDAFFLFAGPEQGTTSLAFAACPALALEVENPQLLGIFAAGKAGAGQWRQFVSPTLAGTSLVLQVVAFDPSLPSSGCVVSNLVTVFFP